jgi:hypothetical protein
MIDGREIYEEDISDMAIATGDLFFPIGEFGRQDYGGIVLTPLCDLAQDKSEWVKLARATPFQIYLEEEFLPSHFKGHNEYREDIAKDPQAFGQSYLRDENNRENRKTLSLVNNLQRILENVSPMKLSHYYLPGKDDATQGFIIDFAYITSVPYEELTQRTRLTRLKSPWREQLINRYASFSLRVGTLDYSRESISGTIQAFFPELETEKIDSKMR